ncbi:hypothetical protein BH24ACT3_BH24ACT3_02650 [soil metagenome]
MTVSERTAHTDGGRPVVATTHFGLPRLAWPRLEDGRWLLLPADDVGTYAERLHEVGVAEVTFAANGEHAADQVADWAPWYRVAEETRLADWRIVVLRRSSAPG